MQKLTLTYRKPVAIIRDNKPILEYEEKQEIFVVASTKSQNNLLDELKADNKIPTDIFVKEVFIDKTKTAESISSMIETLVDDEEIQESVYNHIMSTLDRACVFKHAPIKRSK